MTEQLALVETVLHEPRVDAGDFWAIAAFRRDERKWKLYAAQLFTTPEAAQREAQQLDRGKWRHVTVVRMRLGDELRA